MGFSVLRGVVTSANFNLRESFERHWIYDIPHG